MLSKCCCRGHQVRAWPTSTPLTFYIYIFFLLCTRGVSSSGSSTFISRLLHTISPPSATLAGEFLVRESETTSGSYVLQVSSDEIKKSAFSFSHIIIKWGCSMNQGTRQRSPTVTTTTVVLVTLPAHFFLQLLCSVSNILQSNGLDFYISTNMLPNFFKTLYTTHIIFSLKQVSVYSIVHTCASACTPYPAVVSRC